MARSVVIVFVMMFAVLPATGDEGFRSSGLPQGFEDINLHHFRKSLSKLWGQLTNRDPAELAAKLALTLSSQELSRSLRRWSYTPCLPPELRPVVNKIDSAAALIQLGYDPSQGQVIMGIGPLENFKIVKASWDAKVFEPAYAVLQNVFEPHKYWAIVRGTYSVEDILTDIAAEPVRFMDGHVHEGILRSAKFITKAIKSCLAETKPSRKKARPQLFLAGHSLGGGVCVCVRVYVCVCVCV